MLERVIILTSRRAYEFSPDVLRLSSLSIQPVQYQIQQLFSFQSTAIGTPMASFGEVPSTFPPGMVFNIGAWIHQEEHVVPIRFLHFEQNRIVIDVAGPTSAIDDIADRLFHFLSGLHAADGAAVVGEPARILNYSEITAQFPFSLDTLIAKPLRRILSKMVSRGADDSSMMLVPLIGVQAFPTSEVQSVLQNTNDPHAFTFSLRSGTQPGENIYLSTAPLASDAHLIYLEELAASLQPS